MSHTQGSGHLHPFAGATYCPGQLLVDDRSVDAALRRLERSRRRPAGAPEPIEGLGVTRVVLRGDEGAWPVPEIVHLLRADGLRVGPNRILERRSHLNIRPAAPPSPGQAQPPLNREGELAGHGIRVGVIDSGAWPEHPWLAGQVEVRDADREASPAGEPLAEDIEDHNGTPRLRHHAGHGTFIAGTILQHAPGATVVARRLFRAGHVDDVELGRQILALADVHILNLSLGTRPDFQLEHENDEDLLALMVTANALIELRRRNPELIVLAPAGNEESTDPIWPAAFSSVIAVAALNSERQRADFTNHGPWVDCSAVAAGVPGPFLHWKGALEPARHNHGDGGGGEQMSDGEFNGWATWSGTSFASPVVAGALAALMGDGMDAGSAVAVVLRSPGLRSVPGCGVVVDPPSYVI